MVIFGAGASYDSCSSFPPYSDVKASRSQFPYRLPLAKELFLPQSDFRAISQNYSRFQPLLSYLEDADNVETLMEQFRAEAENDVERQRQLLAIKFYLREVISLCQSRWSHHTRAVSNYQALLDQVRKCPRVCFVTFNYDTLMEGALQNIDVPMRAINDYASHSKSLFKLHGSIDWWQAVPTSKGIGPQSTEQDLIRAAPAVDEHSRIVMSAGRPNDPKAVFLPALAIPTVSKQTFVCPKEHVDALKGIIPEVTKIAIVGWRAGEKHFLKLLKEGLGNKPVKVIAACGNDRDRAETYERIAAARIAAEFSNASSGGFTDFVVNRRIEPFLA